jgi:ATP-dependent Lon protease
VSYVATANAVDPIPPPLRDRLRIVAFPSPTLNDLDVLLPSLMKSIAAEHGVDSRWITSTDAVERSFIASAWSGGSVRRLRHVLEAVIRARDQAARRH